MLGVAQGVGADPGAGDHQGRYPGVAAQGGELLVREAAEVGPAVAGRGEAGVVVLTGDGVEHEVEQMLLLRHVVVERHGARAERGRDPAHGDRVHALGVGDGDRGGGDGGPAVGGAGAPAGALGAQPDQFGRLAGGRRAGGVAVVRLLTGRHW